MSIIQCSDYGYIFYFSVFNAFMIIFYYFVCIFLIPFRLKLLESFAGRVEKALNVSSGHVSQHLHDPVNAFQLTNRYTNGWMKMHENIYHDNGQGIHDREC